MPFINIPILPNKPSLSTVTWNTGLSLPGKTLIAHLYIEGGSAQTCLDRTALGRHARLVQAAESGAGNKRLDIDYQWGTDVSNTPDYTPFEGGLGFAVALNKDANFMGKESLKKQKAEGLRQKHCCLTLEDPDTIVFGNEPIRHAGSVVGWVTSGGFGYSVNKSIAYAYLPVELAKPGTRLRVECFGVEYQATVEKEPTIRSER